MKYSTHIQLVITTNSMQVYAEICYLENTLSQNTMTDVEITHCTAKALLIYSKKKIRLFLTRLIFCVVVDCQLTEKQYFELVATCYSELMSG